MREVASWSAIVFSFLLYAFAPTIRRRTRKKKYARGRRLSNSAPAGESNALPWGTINVPKESATRHFLACGTTGSGKSLIQKRLMKEALKDVRRGADCRALIFDAKNDAVPFLKQVGIGGPIYSLNPFESRMNAPTAVSWDVASDVTSVSYTHLTLPTICSV